MTGKIFSKKVLLAEIESTYGTDPTPVAVNAMLMSNFSMKQEALTVEKRQRAYPNFGADPDMMAQKHITTQFDIEMSGSGTPGTSPLFDPILQACGLNPTVNAGTSVVYAPISTGQKSITQYFYPDGLRHKVLGCRANLKASLAGGKLPMFTFSTIGLYAEATDTAFPSGVTTQLESFVNAIEVNGANTLCVFGTNAVVLEKFEMDLGNSVIFRDRPQNAYVAITDRKMKGSITFEATTVSFVDWQSLVANAQSQALTITHGAVSGNKVQLAFPAVQFGEPSYTDLQGILGVTFPLTFLRTAGDDEVSITFE